MKRIQNSLIRQRIAALAFVFLMFISFVPSASAQKKWTLEECIAYALDHNIQVKQSRLDMEVNEVRELESKLSLLPGLNAGLSHSFGWGRSVDMATYQYVNTQTQSSYFNLSSDVTLFGGFQKLNTIKQRRANYLASKYASDKIQNDISLTVAGAFLQILFSRELLNNAEEQAAVTQQQIDRTRKLVEAGTLAHGSLLEIQAQGANEDVLVIQAENQYKLAYLDLLQLLELKGDTPFEIEIPELEIGLEAVLLPVQQIYSHALGVMPEIKSAEMHLQSSDRALAIARGSRSPSLSMSAALGTNYSDQIRMSNNPFDPDYERVKPFEDQLRNNRSATLSVRLNIPIFNGYQISSYIAQSRLGLESASHSLEQAKNTLRKSVELAYADALAAHSSFQAREKSLINLLESFKYTEQRFNLGMVNAVDYNIAKNLLSKAESELLSSKYDYIFKLKILDFYLGKELSLADIQK